MSDILKPPPWFKPGLLPRKSKFGECCPALRDHVDAIIPVDEWEEHIPKVRMRHLVWHILYQGSPGSCGSEATGQTVYVARELAGLERVKLNPYSLYHYTSYGRDGGSSLDDNMLLACGRHPRWPGKGGIAPQSIWPRSKGWRKEPSEEARAEAWKYRNHEFYDVGNWTELGTALLRGFAISFGYPGHGICGVELVDKSTVRYANSWAESWGDEGFGTIHRRSIEWSYGVFAVRTAIVPTDETGPPTDR